MYYYLYLFINHINFFILLPFEIYLMHDGIIYIYNNVYLNNDDNDMY